VGLGTTQALIDAIDVPAIVTDRHGQPLHSNAAANEILEQIAPSGPLFESLCVGGAATRSVPSESGTLVLDQRLIRWTARPLKGPLDGFVVFTFHDHTENESLLRQVAHLDRLASVGKDMAKIVHELNNPLTSISVAVEMLCQKGKGAQQKLLQQLQRDTARARDLARKVLAFGRVSEPRREAIDANRLALSAVELVRRQIEGGGIALRCTPDPGEPRVEGDTLELRQVLVNLLTNAQHALQEEAPRREIVVTIRSRGRRVRIDVADSGPGMAPELQGRIFELFFTTKGNGDGTGLGLSIARGIVESHGGELRVRSRVGVGTTFTIDLPAAGASVQAVDTRVESCDRLEITHSRRVLVVDDEEALTDLLREILVEAGYQVVTAATVVSALEAIEAQDFDVIMSDVRMPGLGGRDLYRLLEQKSPALLGRLVFMTGDVVSPETASFFRETNARHLAKPFRIRELNEALRSLSDR